MYSRLQLIGAVLRREIFRIMHRPTYRTSLLILPTLSLALFVMLFGKGVAYDLPIAICDNDHTPLSRQITAMIDATPSARVAYNIQSTAEGEELIRKGLIQGFVLIPHSFEKEILGNIPTHLESYIVGTNITNNGLLSKDIQTVAATFSAGIQLQLLESKELPRQPILSQLMPIRFDRHVLFNPYLNYAYYLLPAFMPMMLVILIMVTTVYAIGSELRYASATEWLTAANNSIGIALLGKLLPVTAIFILNMLLMFFLLFEVVGLPLNGSFSVLLIGTLFLLLSYQSIAIMLVALLANLRLSLSLGGGYSVLAFSFSGFTFPTLAMWEPIRWGSHLFPFSYYADLAIDQLMRGAPIDCSLPDLGMLSIFLFLPLFSLPRLNRICHDERYWRKI